MASDAVVAAFDEVATEVAPVLEAVAGDAAAEIGVALGIDAAPLREAAVQVARNRAAELVGRRWKDGELVPAKNPLYAITDTTRAGIGELVEGALEEGWSVQRLADELEATYAFSEKRAELIAKTEIGNADASGRHRGAVDAGAKWKRSVLAPNHDHGAEDVANAAAGWIPIDDPFPSGHQHPLYHPGCLCALEYSFSDEKPS